MSTQDPEGADLGDRFARAAKPHGTMSVHGEDPDDDTGEDVLPEDETEGHADVFSPGRTDQPD
ncbi:hypothetical protein [Ornithinimicrobium cavernae]|uniref:hypothetical protein n=1 Tax=Ornithinimicrobium cavernae TaxID=2666047 RepID=UPI000D6961ED|nr:hypothetical protein [Ornithinimicrobium cavernae]